MPKDYFVNFPRIEYSNNVVTDVTRRAVLVDDVLRRGRAPLEVRDGVRPDTVADKYYGDPGATWLVLMSAGVIDPWYDWHADDEQMSILATTRFGSVEEAQRRTRYYATNWADNAEQQITPAGWDALADGEKKYWEPVLGATSRTVAYRRLREDWFVTTNLIVGVTGTANGTFTTNERVNFTQGPNIVANSQIVWANSTFAYAQHVVGLVDDTISTTMTGANSGATMTVTDFSIITINVPAAEQAYWSAVSEWDHLELLNAQKRNVMLVESRYVDQAQLELKKKLR